LFIVDRLPLIPEHFRSNEKSFSLIPNPGKKASMSDKKYGASPDAIQHHYDVGNDFYRTWLDESMTYSCALWDDATDLQSAQMAKLDFHAVQAQCRGADRVLDVGCGWGGMLERLVQVHEVKKAVGLTLSEEQAAWVRAKNLSAIEARVEAWGDHEPTEPYDAIVSVGAIEHFASLDESDEEKVNNYRQFFARCHKWLRPGGRISLQAMAYGNLLRDDIRGGFVSKEIFPESDFVKLSEIVAGSEYLFEIERLRNDPLDYARTCQEWLDRLRKNREEAVAAAGKELTDKWEKYLELSVRGWEMRATNLLRITMRRIDTPRVPERTQYD
jgi:cyclopropane-fatty-acyl-phospholipid synthase